MWMGKEPMWKGLESPCDRIQLRRIDDKDINPQVPELMIGARRFESSLEECLRHWERRRYKAA